MHQYDSTHQKSDILIGITKLLEVLLAVRLGERIVDDGYFVEIKLDFVRHVGRGVCELRDNGYRGEWVVANSL